MTEWKLFSYTEVSKDIDHIADPDEPQWAGVGLK